MHLNTSTQFQLIYHYTVRDFFLLVTKYTYWFQIIYLWFLSVTWKRGENRTTEDVFVWCVFCCHLQSLPRAVPAASNSWYFTCQKFSKSPAFSWVSIPVLIWDCHSVCAAQICFTQVKWFLNIGVLAVLLQKQDVCLHLLCFGIYCQCRMFMWLKWLFKCVIT